MNSLKTGGEENHIIIRYSMSTLFEIQKVEILKGAKQRTQDEEQNQMKKEYFRH